MAKEEAVQLVHDREAERIQRFEPLRGEMTVTRLAAPNSWQREA